LKRKNKICGVCFLEVAAGLLLLPAITFAKANEEPGAEFNSGQWIWALFSLAIVVALAYWATKFLAGKFGVSGAKHLKVAESLFLGPNRHLYLLLVNHKILLIGCSEHGISLLQQINDSEFYAELERTAEKNQTLPPDKFSGMIGPILRSLNPRGVNDSGVTDPKQRLNESLAKIRSWRTRGRDQ
jgi:flagellar biogenesis protein FliO